MKYIFLDIDGVMKSGRCYFKGGTETYGDWDPLAVDAINRLGEKTGASIVFNTTWNLYNIIDIAEAQGITAKIAGKTIYPQCSSIEERRMEAINHWLLDHPAKYWVALDDCRITHENAILVDPEIGITPQNYREACKLLGSPDVFMLLL